MYDIGVWYRTEVQKWRTTASIAWVSIVTFPVAFLFLLLAKVSLIHPFSWIMDGLLSAFNFSSWSFIGFSCFMFTFLATWNSNYYTVRPVVLTTRLAHMVHMLNIHHLLHALGHGITLSVCAWCFTGLLGESYSSLSQKCAPESTVWCLNEKHLFIVLHGLYVGILYAVSFIGGGQNYLHFPIVQQPKFFIVKSEIYSLFVSSAISCLKKMRIYYLLYYILIGPFARQWIGSNIDLREGEDNLGFIGLLNLSLFWGTFLSGTWMLFTLSLARTIHTVYQTQPYEFSLSVPFDGKEDRCLHKALLCVHNPLVQHLGYLDLYLMAKQNIHRRAELFSLSQPGGHPHNWNNISTQLFNTLNLLSERIREYNDKASVASGQARQLSGDKTPLIKQSYEVDVGHGTPSGLRQRSTPITTLGPNITSPQQGTDQVVSPKTSAIGRITDHIKKRKAVAFFTSELPESQSQKLFVDAQVHIWAVDALAELTVASYEEDKFGVVQKSLPDIITSLLVLQEAVEKFSKLAPGQIKRDGLRNSQDGAIRNSLKATLKTAIYRIVNTFGKHFSGIHLSPEHNRRLLHFVDFKE